MRKISLLFILCLPLVFFVTGCKRTVLTLEQTSEAKEQAFVQGAKKFFQNKAVSQGIHLKSPAPNQGVASPVAISGEAAGFWFYHSGFSVYLSNEAGDIIASGNVYMDPITADYDGNATYQFTGSLVFDWPKSKAGKLTLQNGRPAINGYPVQELSVPVRFDNELQQAQNAKNCLITGCNKELCSENEMGSDCSNASVQQVCLRQARCELQKNGYCGWTYTDGFFSCLRRSSLVQ